MRHFTTAIYLLATGVVIFSLFSGRTVWLIVGLIPFAYLFWQVFASNSHSLSAEKTISSQVNKLVAAGEKISIEFDNCEFKDSSYTNEVIDERSTRLNAINLDYGKVIRRDLVEQSLLIYHHPTAGKSEKFIQAFPCSAETLRVYVLQNLVSLYVDRFDRSHYFFDLKSS